MDTNIELFSLSVSLSYAKQKNFYNRQYVLVESKNLYYPACVVINKKSKMDMTLVDNGCIPDQLDKENYQVNPTCKWLFAQDVTLKYVKELNEENSQSREDGSADYTFTSLCDIPNFEELKCLIRKGFDFKDVYLKTGMKIRFKFLTQRLIFIVHEITNCFYAENACLDKTALKCTRCTKLDIIEDSPEMKKISLDFCNFGGYKNEIQDLKDNIDNFLCGKKGESGILIAGISGTGKSFIGTILNSMYSNKCIVLGPEDILTSYVGEAEANLRKIFLKASSRGPSIIFIDNIDDLCLKKGKNESNIGVVNALLYLIDGVQTSQFKDILVIGTASQPELLDLALRRPGRLSHDIILNQPDEAERLSILQCCLKDILSTEIEENLTMIAAKTSGFVAADIMILIGEAYSLHNDDGKSFPPADCFTRALRRVKPLSLKNVASNSCKVPSEEFCGYSELKTDVMNVFKVSLQYKKLFLLKRVLRPTRILLFGPSGCGKSLMVNTLAKNYNLTVIPVKRSSIFGKYLGESEKNLGVLFQQAAKCSPCILHFENFDGVAGRRSKNSEDTSSDVEERVINHLKVMLDGVQGFDDIFVIAETNRPDLLDKNVIRRGRFHKYFYFSLPTLEDRTLFIKKALANVDVEVYPSKHEQIDQIAKSTEGFTVAEVVLLCGNVVSSLKRSPSSYDDETTSGDERFEAAIEDSLDTVMPNVSAKMLKRHQEFSCMYYKKL